MRSRPGAVGSPEGSELQNPWETWKPLGPPEPRNPGTPEPRNPGTPGPLGTSRTPESQKPRWMPGAPLSCCSSRGSRRPGTRLRGTGAAGTRRRSAVARAAAPAPGAGLGARYGASVEIDTSGGPARVELRGQPQSGAPGFLLVATHGAGGSPDTKDVLAVAKAAEDLGAVTALVTQPYRVRGARAPGSAVKQDLAWTELIAKLREETGHVPLVQCGRSNGARVTCRTAQAVKASGVIALAFPLHPPGYSPAHPEKSRAGELAAAGTPVLVVNGDRDPFGIPEGSDSTRVVVLPGETHSLAKNPAAIGETVAAWLRALPGLP
jgi:uncharacterized protein